MGSFTGVDKALLQRCARGADAQADALYGKHDGQWSARIKECADDKREHDRLRRDAHDLRALARRLGMPAPHVPVES